MLGNVQDSDPTLPTDVDSRLRFTGHFLILSELRTLYTSGLFYVI